MAPSLRRVAIAIWPVEVVRRASFANCSSVYGILIDRLYSEACGGPNRLSVNRKKPSIMRTCSQMVDLGL